MGQSMLNIQRLTFNPFQVNTYVIWDETRECAIVDAGCYGEAETARITSFITEQGLKPARLINTHCHIDHIAGVAFLSRHFGLDFEAHNGGLKLIHHSQKACFIYGFDHLETIEPKVHLKEGDIIRFGDSEMEVIETPGHADGSLCFISHRDQFVITGDVLFYQSIGRSDLPTGNYDVLMKSIREKLLTLPPDYTVYPGHGPETSIGFEANSNPFLG
jgi:glyoxylase-like metal-dependent hydrolase (beta-lactamase superfamily II)